MPRLRVSLAFTMAIVLLAAFGFAALSSPTVFWASGCFALAVTLVFAAAVGAFAPSPYLRMPCAGFMVFGGGYLVIVFLASPQAQGASIPPLLTTEVLHMLRDWQTPRIARTQGIVDQQPTGFHVAEPTIYSTGPSNAANPKPKQSPNLIIDADYRPVGTTFTAAGITYTAVPTLSWLNHRRIGHALLAILHGFGGALIGGLIGSRCTRRAESSP